MMIITSITYARVQNNKKHSKIDVVNYDCTVIEQDIQIEREKKSEG